MQKYNLQSERTFRIKIFFALMLLLSNYCYSQTTSSSYRSLIKSKEQQLEANIKKLENYNLELEKLEIFWKQKQMNYHQDLSALIKERDNLIGDMKTGAKCSQCGKYKSEFEKQGTDFQKHLGEVKGHAIPASTEELESTRKKYSEMIAYKKVQIQNAEKGDKNLDYKRVQIINQNKNIASLNSEITDLRSKLNNAIYQEEMKKHETQTIAEKTMEGVSKSLERYDGGGEGAGAAKLLKDKLDDK